MFYSKIAVLSALVAMVLGAPVASNSSGVIHVPLRKVKTSGKNANITSVAKRSVPETSLQFTGIEYLVTYTIGGQQQVGIVDTGSSDTWTFSNLAGSGGYNPSESSTYTWLNNDFEESYGYGNNNIEGTWGTDTVGLGGVEVPNYPIAFLNQSDPQWFPNNQGIFALGPESSETFSPHHPTFVERLKDAGTIQSYSFSIYSDSSDSSALLLGGIDTAKYDGPLYTLGFDYSEIYGNHYYTVDFEFEGTTYTGGALDTGTSNVLLPQDVASSVASQYGAQWSQDAGGYVTYSQPPDNLPALDFQIGGVTVSIPGDQVFILEQSGQESVWLFVIANNIEGEGYELNILGDPLLRQLYLFFDIEKNEVAFAPYKQTSESNLVAVGDSIPDSQPAPNQNEGGFWW